MQNELKTNRQVSIIVPAFDEEKTIREVISELQALSELDTEIIVVDDGSEDNTGEIAAEAGVDKLIRHRHKKGYGAAIKSGIKAASFPLVATYDADGQHLAKNLAHLVALINSCDMAVGDRSASEKLTGRTPGKKLLSLVANFLARQTIPDLNSGLRVIKKEWIEKFWHILPDGFSFSTTLTLALIKEGAQVEYIPVEVRQRGKSKSTVNPLKDGFNTLLLIIRTIVLFDPLRVFLPASIALFLLGLIYSVINILVKNEFNIPDGAILLIISSVLVFFFGILADQVSALRREIK